MQQIQITQHGAPSVLQTIEVAPPQPQAIDPLKTPGNELQEVLMNCNRMAMGELPISSSEHRPKR